LIDRWPRSKSLSRLFDTANWEIGELNRDDFIRLAEVRLTEAKALASLGHFAGAYYLAGYSVECALKACIAKLTNQYDFPPTAKDLNNIYTHDLDRLLNRAGLAELRITEYPLLTAGDLNWRTVVKWSEETRYQLRSQSECESLISAIDDNDSGVLQWIRKHW
jgi:HEPN domain-containing protein